MLLILDVGNTNIKIGIYDNNNLTFKARISTDKFKTKDEYTIQLDSIFKVYSVSVEDIKGAIIGCVVPQITQYLTDAIFTLTNIKPLCVGPGIKTGLNILLNNPAATGADLVASSVATIEMYPVPAIIISLGTATTISIVNSDKAMIGGLLMPGVGISLNALSEHAALLPNISLEAPKNIIGKTTEDCMKSGSIIANAAMVDGVCDRIEAELGQKCTVIATGGLASTIIPSCNRDIEINDELILLGLKYIYEKNV